MRNTNSIGFPSKPAPEVLALLKSWGFRWNRYSKQWVAARSVTSATVIDAIRAGVVDAAEVNERVAVANMEADCGVI